MKRKAFALRVEEELLQKVESWAKEEYRSTNGQIEWMLKKMLESRNRYN